MALQQPIRFSSASKELRDSSGLIRLRRRRPNSGVLSSGFCDRGHLQYYKSSSAAAAEEVAVSGRRMSVKEVKSGKEEKSVKKMKKKQLKLLKGLSKDLSTFSQMGFGLDNHGALLDQIKGNMITEATQLLLEQLQKVKAEEKEIKRKLKEEKARMKAAARMQIQIGGNCEMSSSSSSSESSDSECGEVVEMSSLKRGLQQVEEEAAPPYPTPIIPTLPSSYETDLSGAPPSIVSPQEDLSLQPSSSSSGQAPSCCSKKIEVCMGGKCKKSGAGALLEEFQRVVGIEGAVSGCKCMGKCKEGPNVKVVNALDAVATAASNALCIGVGLEDVNVIVANFIDEHQNQNQNQLGFSGAS